MNTATLSTIPTTSSNPSVLDWITEPIPSQKKALCGQVTQITLYTNNTILVQAYYCHRFDCPRCGLERKQQIKDKILKASNIWYVKSISENEYTAITKRINRSGSKYCVIGSGDKLLLMTLNPVIEGSKASLGSVLESQIDKYLDCAYDYRQRRFKHSQGLFPAEEKSDPVTHIERIYAINFPKDKVIQIFGKGGYLPIHYGRQSFLTPMGLKIRSMEDILSKDFGLGNIAWAEAGHPIEYYNDN
jgi:hypothetical protein